MTNEKIETTIRKINEKYAKKRETREIFERNTRDNFNQETGDWETYGLDTPYHTGKREYKVPLVVLWQIEAELWEKSRFKWRYLRTIGLKIALVTFLLGIGVGVWVTLKLSSQATI